MEALSYRVFLRKEPEGGFTVNVPSLPGCITFGESLDEAMSMATATAASVSVNSHDMNDRSDHQHAQEGDVHDVPK